MVRCVRPFVRLIVRLAVQGGRSDFHKTRSRRASLVAGSGKSRGLHRRRLPDRAPLAGHPARSRGGGDNRRSRVRDHAPTSRATGARGGVTRTATARRRQPRSLGPALAFARALTSAPGPGGPPLGGLVALPSGAWWPSPPGPGGPPLGGRRARTVLTRVIRRLDPPRSLHARRVLPPFVRGNVRNLS
jgi:hypothetical protein